MLSRFRPGINCCLVPGWSFRRTNGLGNEERSKKNNDVTETRGEIRMSVYALYRKLTHNLNHERPSLLRLIHHPSPARHHLRSLLRAETKNKCSVLFGVEFQAY